MSVSKRFLFLGIPGSESIFHVSHGESLKKITIVDGRIRTHDPKNPHGLSTTPFVKEPVGY